MDKKRLSKAIVALVELITRLRGPDGCPWDAQQTYDTIKIYLLEEAYEVLEAIEAASPTSVCQELGDLLFQILFLAHIAEERKEFDFTEVVEQISEKMIRRHPHVFGEAKVDSPAEVAFNWAKIKEAEKQDNQDPFAALHSVSEKLPALLRAHRISERASKVDPDWTAVDGIWDDVLERFEKIKGAVAEHDKGRFGEDMGALLFGLADLTRQWGFNSEHLLRMRIKEILERFSPK